VQVSTAGAEVPVGQKVKDMVSGRASLAEFAHHVAARYSINIALHTDHCPKDKLDGYMRPLIKISQERVAEGAEPLFQSHMWDGSAVELEENLSDRAELLEVRAGAHRDGARDRRGRRRGGRRRNEINEKLYTTPVDALRRRGARARRERAATCWRRRSATCTASTSRATSS
jgi:fructose-bisphosphate aldolase class II